jgi:hypothetical protein
MKAIRIPGFDLTRKWLGSSREFNLGTVGSVLQAVALYFAISEYKSSDRFDSTMAGYSAIMASMSLTATIVETVATAVEKTPTHPLSIYLYEQWSFSPNIARKVIPLAKRTALIAGLLAASLDVFAGWSALLKGKLMLGGLYLASAALGVLLTLSAFSIGATFFWPAFVAALVVAIALSLYKKTLLKKWITRCFYAKGAQAGLPSQAYSSLEEELMAYDTALGGP